MPRPSSKRSPPRRTRRPGSTDRSAPPVEHRSPDIPSDTRLPCLPHSTPCGRMAATALDPRPRTSRPPSAHKAHRAAGPSLSPLLRRRLRPGARPRPPGQDLPFSVENAVRYCSQLDSRRSVPVSVPWPVPVTGHSTVYPPVSQAIRSPPGPLARPKDRGGSPSCTPTGARRGLERGRARVHPRFERQHAVGPRPSGTAARRAARAGRTRRRGSRTPARAAGSPARAGPPRRTTAWDRRCRRLLLRPDRSRSG